MVLKWQEIELQLKSLHHYITTFIFVLISFPALCTINSTPTYVPWALSMAVGTTVGPSSSSSLSLLLLLIRDKEVTAAVAVVD